MAANPALRGRAKVAHELGVSERTVSRWARKGLIAVDQPGGRTSAWRVEATDLNHLRRRRDQAKRS